LLLCSTHACMPVKGWHACCKVSQPAQHHELHLISARCT
jgi:hypothetical protein